MPLIITQRPILNYITTDFCAVEVDYARAATDNFTLIGAPLKGLTLSDIMQLVEGGLRPRSTFSGHITHDDGICLHYCRSDITGNPFTGFDVTDDACGFIELTSLNRAADVRLDPAMPYSEILKLPTIESLTSRAPFFLHHRSSIVLGHTVKHQ